MKPKNITLAEFAYTFVPFGLLLSIALLAAEATLDLPEYRMIYSIWVAEALTIPALCLYILQSPLQTRYNYEALLWSFAYGAYLVHFYYAVFVHYHGSLAEVFSHQGVKIAGPNFLLTVWWGLDILITWTNDSFRRWVQVERALGRFLVFAVFFTSSVLIFKGFVNFLGYTLTAAVLLSFAVRFFRWRATLTAPDILAASRG
jgi:hypothetical protein